MPRPHWREQCNELGFTFHSIDGLYWEERYAYEFTEAQIDYLDDATRECHQLCLEAVAHVLKQDWLDLFKLPEDFKSLVESSWFDEDFSLYSRFDFSWNGTGDPKLLEYNADTPTGLLEASVVQWHWLQDVMPRADQFNSIHEKLIGRWQAWREKTKGAMPLHFACMTESEEDWGNLSYLEDTAQQAGWQTEALGVADLGWDSENHELVGLKDESIRHLFKLYPWEWLICDPFGKHLAANAVRKTKLIEPAWKVLMSSKALLPVLWELFPKHPNLLETYFDSPTKRARFEQNFVRKPLYSREGANITLYTQGQVPLETQGQYGESGYVIQALAPLPKFGDHYTCIGSWLVGNEPAGIGIREDFTPITKDSALFVPHYFL
jgi:glutathionylspermidine synthase